MQLGYNIFRGSGDGVPRAIKGLEDQIRQAHEQFEVAFVAGMTLKEDGKASYHACQQVMLSEKYSGQTVLKDEDTIHEPAPPSSIKPPKKVKP
jgi:hypothetical protein